MRNFFIVHHYFLDDDFQSCVKRSYFKSLRMAKKYARSMYNLDNYSLYVIEKKL